LIRIVIIIVVIWLVSRPVLDFRVRNWLGTLGIGVVIFGLWVLPDLLFPGYRHLWLFDNSVVGPVRSSLSAAEKTDPLVLALRTFRAAALVPILEELFWRGWLMRWLMGTDFRKVALGAYSGTSFWVVAALFASEHGPYWDVGLIAGILFNFWMVRTKSLGDLILAHAVANLCLSAYVIAAGKWEYWL
jgi:CAAX protease family protein